MPLAKKSTTAVVEPPKQDPPTPEQMAQVATAKENAAKAAPMTKDDYWRRREERDVQRDKDMAWSGLAQAALGSPFVGQLNMDNTEEGLVTLVCRITDKLLKSRDSR